jgi:hypothetical protein
MRKMAERALTTMPASSSGPLQSQSKGTGRGRHSIGRRKESGARSNKEQAHMPESSNTIQAATQLVYQTSDT